MIPKKSLLNISFKYYIKHKIQSILLIFGISLGVAVIVAIDIANTNARSSFDKSIRSISGIISHSVYGSTTGLNEDVYFSLRKRLGYKNVVPLIEESVYLKQFPHQEFKIIGIDPFSDSSLLKFFESYEISLNSSSFELFLTEQNSAIISNELLHELGLGLGESVIINFNSADREIKIVGTVDSSNKDSPAFSRNKILVDIATAQEVLDYKGILTRIDLNLESYSKEKIEEIKNFLELNHPGSYLIRSDSIAKESNKLTKSFELNLTALSLITLLIAFFLIYNSFNYSLVVRRPVFSILRSIGVTSKEVFYLILAEALIIGLLSSIIGLVLGIILGEFSVRLVSNTLTNIYSVFGQTTFEISPLSLLKAVCIGIAAVISAAFIPSLESRFIKPISLIKNSYFNLSFMRFVPYLFLGGVLLILSGLYLTVFLVSNITTTFIGLFLIIIGYTLLLPASMVILGRILNRYARLFLGKIYLIPCRNYITSIDKNYVATASLTVAVAVFLSMTVLIESFRSTLSVWLENTFASDVFVSAVNRPNENNGLDFNLLQKIKSVKGINRVGYSRKIELITDRYGKLNLIALSENPPINPQIISGLDNEFPSLERLEGNTVLVSESFNNRYKHSLKDGYIFIPTKKGKQKFRIAGVFSDFTTQRGTLILKHGLFQKFWDDNKITSISLNVLPGFEINNVLINIRNSISESYDYRLSTNRDLKQSAHKIFNQTFAITNAMRIIAFLVAFFGILGALLALEFSRKKEIGVLRSLGVKVSEIKKIIFFETGIIGLLSGILSIPLGLIMAYILVNVINLESFGWTINFLIKPIYLFEAIFISLFAALLAGIYPSIIFSKIRISQAIREE